MEKGRFKYTIDDCKAYLLKIKNRADLTDFEKMAYTNGFTMGLVLGGCEVGLSSKIDKIIDEIWGF